MLRDRTIRARSRYRQPDGDACVHSPRWAGDKFSLATSASRADSYIWRRDRTFTLASATNVGNWPTAGSLIPPVNPCKRSEHSSRSSQFKVRPRAFCAGSNSASSEAQQESRARDYSGPVSRDLDSNRMRPTCHNYDVRPQSAFPAPIWQPHRRLLRPDLSGVRVIGARDPGPVSSTLNHNLRSDHSGLPLDRCRLPAFAGFVRKGFIMDIRDMLPAIVVTRPDYERLSNLTDSPRRSPHLDPNQRSVVLLVPPD
jgi:hypothetical protein